MVKEASYTIELILDQFYEIESVNVVMGEQDITAEVYNEDNKTISIEKLTDNVIITIIAKVELDNVATLVQMVDENCNYTTMNEAISDTELFNGLLSNEKTLDYIFNSKNIILPAITSNTQAFTAVINHENSFQAWCENENALNSTRTNETLYNGKAFVLGVSQDYTKQDETGVLASYQLCCMHCGQYLSCGSIECQPPSQTYGTDRYEVWYQKICILCCCSNIRP